MTTPSPRTLAKADRRTALLRAAARLFAEHGYGAVGLADIGGAAGVSGPAIYRHFASKQALLGELLVGASTRLLAGGRAVLDRVDAPGTRLEELVRFQVDFALVDADVIRVQDRDLTSLSDDDLRAVRRLQREYVEVWVGVLQALRPKHPDTDLRMRAHACFGLINSTPHSTRHVTEPADVRGTLEAMALAALLA